MGVLHTLPAVLNLANCGYDSNPIQSQISPQDWPIQEPCSDIQHLQFDDAYGDSPVVITTMIGSCKALSSFTINEAANCDPRDQLRYWDALLASLGLHASSLKILSICAPRDFIILSPEMEVTRIEGFDQFYNLESLGAPWTMLMGKPVAQLSGSENLPGEDWEGHSSMTGVLPPTLRSFACYNEQWVGPTLFYDAFLSLLPMVGMQSTTVKEFRSVYGMWRIEAAVPWDHMQMQSRVRDGGIDFKLKVRKFETRSRDSTVARPHVI